GFSGLIVALRKQPGPLTGVQKFRLQVLLALAFGALFLSFLPDLLRALDVSESRILQSGNASLVVYTLVFWSWLTLRSLRVYDQAPEIINWFAFARMSAGHFTVIAIQLWVLIWGRSDLATGAYLLGLIWYLVHAAQQFCRMLFVQVAEDT
ncbi:MAG: hypothetical protein R3212_04110, partial [Xanthomonadales bacterium]|nr:hypothetical protein [Xanthomonadales bacterium]